MTFVLGWQISLASAPSPLETKIKKMGEQKWGEYPQNSRSWRADRPVLSHFADMKSWILRQ